MFRRSVVPIAALALAASVTGCGSDSDEAATATSPADSTVATVDAVDTVTVEGAYGPIDVPADPQRIVGDLMALDYMTALGIDDDRFVGVFDAGFFPDDHYLADELGREGLVDPGFQWEPNLEALAAADPDVIVVPFDQIDGAPQLGEMEEIAPVLVVPTSDTRDPRVRYGGTASFQDWRSTLRSFGEVFGRQDEAESYIAETEAEIAALQADYGDVIADTTATEMKSTPDFVAINALNSALESGVLGTILMSELGFTSPPQQAAVTVDEFGSIDISQENLDLVDGDLLFVEVREDTRTYEDSPLWDTLPVVQNDGVVEVGNHWEYGGARAARVVLADIRAALEGITARS